MLSFIDTIFSLVWDISQWFYDGYYEVKHWVWPFNLLQYPLLGLSQAFWALLTPIANFHDWAYTVWDRVKDFLDIDTIKALLKQWLDWAAWAWQWVQDAWYIVQAWISARLETFGGIVKGWIAVATQGFNDLVTAWNNFWNITWPRWMKSFDALASAWDNFWTVIFPNLVSFQWLVSWWNDRVKDVQSLIDTAFKLRESWWQGWQQIKEQVFDFFSDPLEFLLERFTDWFLGPED